MKRIMFISLIFFIFSIYAAQSTAESQDAVSAWNKVVTEAKNGGYRLITPEELKNEYLENSTSFLLIDTRQEWAYQMQHIKGALHIDFAPIWWNQYSPVIRSEMKKLLGPNKNEKIVFY